MKVYIITDDGGYRYGEAFKDKEKAIKHMIGVIRVMYDIYVDGKNYKPTFEYKYSFP